MPTPPEADAKIEVHPPQSDTSNMALDLAGLSVSETVKSKNHESDTSSVAHVGYTTNAAPMNVCASRKTDKRRAPRRPKPRAVISADPVAAEERYINREQLRELIPASDMTLWRWQRDPEIAFPLPSKLGAGGRNFWWLPAVRAWLRKRETGTSTSTVE
jgi:predicted DNA-binding transcriptional regulator AlpA